MILFNTDQNTIYNKIIHNYLEIEIFGNPDIEIGDIIEDLFPKYLYREQYYKCIEVFKELYEWTDDLFIHELTSFHEMGLYYFLEYINNIKKDMDKDFINIYYDKKLNKEIDKYLKNEVEEYKKDFPKEKVSIEEFKEFYYDPFYICDIIFEDTDFIELPYLYNEYKFDMPIIAERLGINLDYYFEVLPMDIQRKYKSKHITLTGEVSGLFRYLQRRITYGSLAELFWEDNKPISERKIHIIIENIMDSYFLEKDVDISREVLVKNGQIDFKLFRSKKKEEMILIEVKKASSSYLKAGYENQLCYYIKYSNCKNAFYLIVCFYDKDYTIAQNFIQNHVYTDNFQMYINIALLDVRRNPSPSKK